MSKALYLVSYFDRDDGQKYQLIVTDTYENAVKYVKYDFESELLPNNFLRLARNLVLENVDGDWSVKDLDAEETEFCDSQFVGDYNIEHIELYEGSDIDELLK